MPAGENMPDATQLPSPYSLVSVPSAAPPFRAKLLFWLLLGALSVILAEVVSFSSPLAFFDAWGLLVVCPLYTLHTLVLAYLIFQRRRVTLQSLLLAGAIFGLYEAYITKILWHPTWGDMPWVAGGLYLGQTAILVLFWHPVMAFILPLLVAESSFTGTSETAAALPGFVQTWLQSPRGRWFVIAGFAVFCGLPAGVNSPSAAASLLSAVAAGAVFAGLAFLWQHLGQRQGYPFRSLLPARREAAVLIGLLLLGYVWHGALIRPEALPGTLGPHLTIWCLYLFLFVLLFLNIRQSPECTEPSLAMLRPLPWRALLVFWLIFTLTSTLGVAAKNVAGLGVLLSWLIGISVGLLILGQSVLIALRGKTAR